MIDPVTTEQLAKFMVKEMLERAEKDRLVAELTRSNGSFFTRAGLFVTQWARRFKNPSPQTPVRYRRATDQS